jgi:hypothetical protein
MRGKRRKEVLGHLLTFISTLNYKVVCIEHYLKKNKTTTIVIYLNLKNMCICISIKFSSVNHEIVAADIWVREECFFELFRPNHPVVKGRAKKVNYFSYFLDPRDNFNPDVFRLFLERDENLRKLCLANIEVLDR